LFTWDLAGKTFHRLAGVIDKTLGRVQASEAGGWDWQCYDAVLNALEINPEVLEKIFTLCGLFFFLFLFVRFFLLLLFLVLIISGRSSF
jgi:hypothetical protein